MSKNTNGITLDTDDNFICRARVSDEGKITSYCVGGYRIIVEIGDSYKKFTVTKEEDIVKPAQFERAKSRPKIQVTPMYMCMTDGSDYTTQGNSYKKIGQV